MKGKTFKGENQDWSKQIRYAYPNKWNSCFWDSVLVVMFEVRCFQSRHAAAAAYGFSRQHPPFPPL